MEASRGLADWPLAVCSVGPPGALGVCLTISEADSVGGHRPRAGGLRRPSSPLLPTRFGEDLPFDLECGSQCTVTRCVVCTWRGEGRPYIVSVIIDAVIDPGIVGGPQLGGARLVLPA